MLFLTKPLGTGIVATAIKFGRIPPALASPVDEVVESMRTLNRAAAEALQALPAGAVHACTDVTGFGLIGHASEMAAASGVTLAIEVGKVPLFTGVLELAAGNRSGGMALERGALCRRGVVAAGVRRPSRPTVWPCCTTRRPPAGC